MQFQGQKIDNLITHRGLIQKVVAKLVGWNPSSFNRKIKGETMFDVDTLTELSKLLMVSVDFLTDGSIDFQPGDPIPETALLKPEPQENEPPPEKDDTVHSLVKTQEMLVRDLVGVGVRELDRPGMPVEIEKSPAQV